MPAEQATCTPRIGQLVGSDADVIELLSDRQGDAVTIVQSAPTGRENGPLSALTPGLFRPALALEELELGGPSDYGQDHQGEAELDSSDAHPRLRHQRTACPGVEGTAKRTNS